MNIGKKEIDSIKRKIPERENQIKYAENRIAKTEEELKEPPSNDTSELEAAIVSGIHCNLAVDY
jgi:peptidoglycan hydrolase CwlO-like protein